MVSIVFEMPYIALIWLPMLQQVSRVESKSKFKFKGLFLYTGGVLFHVEWCIRKPALIFFYQVP